MRVLIAAEHDQDDIKKLGDVVVVASHARMHEPTFQNAVAEDRSHRYDGHIREHVSWVIGTALARPKPRLVARRGVVLQDGVRGKRAVTRLR
jgi:heterodisulfide reductase subunit A-like polyferredoxin